MPKINKKIFILFFLVFLALTIYVLNNYFYKEHRNISSELPEYNTTTDQLRTEFTRNIDAFETNYLNKTIVVSGKISEIKKDYVVLDNSVLCQFMNQIKIPLELASLIKIKGRFIGYDDLLEEIKIDQCIILEQ
jgi:hypothetical protein